MRKATTNIFLLLLLIASGSLAASAQTVKVTGTIIESSSKQPLISANVILVNLRDSTLKHLATTDAKGAFVFPSIAPQRYRLEIRYIGYTDYTKMIMVGSSSDNKDLKIITVDI